MALERKYVIFKAEDWDAFFIEGHKDWDPLAERDIAPDSVVIRKQDVFAPNALYEYANQIRGACELAEKIMAKVPQERDDELERLRRLADDFFDEAMDSEEHYQKKVPD